MGNLLDWQIEGDDILLLILVDGQVELEGLPKELPILSDANGNGPGLGRGNSGLSHEFQGNAL